MGKSCIEEKVMVKREMKLLRILINLILCRGNQAGVTMVEAAVALGIVAMVSIAFLGGLATAQKATMLAQEKATAESLAQTQLEHAKKYNYVYGAGSYAAAPVPSESDYTDYSAQIDAQALNNPDDGIQRITVTVSRNSQPITILQGYKVDR